MPIQVQLASLALHLPQSELLRIPLLGACQGHHWRPVSRAHVRCTPREVLTKHTSSLSLQLDDLALLRPCARAADSRTGEARGAQTGVRVGSTGSRATRVPTLRVDTVEATRTHTVRDMSMLVSCGSLCWYTASKKTGHFEAPGPTEKKFALDMSAAARQMGGAARYFACFCRILPQELS